MLKLNGEKINITKFPNGEALIKDSFSSLKSNNFTVTMKFESDEDLIHLMMVTKHLKDFGKDVSLVMPYIPYSRLDRTEGKTVFTLKYVCNLINSLNFTKVTVYEPHSDVSVALLDRVEVINSSATFLLNEAIAVEKDFDITKDFIVFPDSGAEKRYSKQVSSKNILTAIKHRDFETGYIKNLEIIGEAPKGFNAIIVDDLCCKGGTFMLTANSLKEMGANNISLVVTHCENSILEGDILKKDSAINKVYTTDSIFDMDYFLMSSEQFKMKYGRNKDLSKLNIIRL